MANHSEKDAQIGWWYTYCCRLDLSQIEDQETLDEVRIVGASVSVWPTKQEALEDLPEEDEQSEFHLAGF
jgi:hypothetical protein